ncbi:MAG TPA: HNH endonuclease [Sphaerochaeta sp.]|nr:HNH endonuclease [Sphaerochaeta sp.]
MRGDTMIRDYYGRYIKDILKLRESTVNHYLGAISALNRILRDNQYPITDLYHVSTKENLEDIEFFLNQNEEYRGLNARGNNMYSAALHNLMKFASAQMFHSSEIFESLDQPVEVAEQTMTLVLKDKRRSIIKDQVIHAAHFCCECDLSHTSFTAKATLCRYVEGHHLIPLQRQTLFPYSLDVYANVVSLCPNCHRLLHLAIKTEKKYYLDRLFDERKARLVSSGIDISHKEFLRLTL